MLSGPTAFATLNVRDRNTSSLETKSSCGTRLGGESPVKGVNWSVRLTKSHQSYLQVIWYSWYPQEIDGITPAKCLGMEWLYLPLRLTGISGFHLSNFNMTVVIFSFFDLALDLVPPKFVIRRVPSKSEKCRFLISNEYTIQFVVLQFS